MNQIILGDAYELIKNVPDKSVNLIYTDIPYDIDGNGGGGCFGEKKRDYHREYYDVCENTQASGVTKRTGKLLDEIKDIAFGIDYNILNEFIRIQPKIYIYIWCSKKQILPLMKFFIEQHNCNFDLLTWHKTNPIPTCNNKYLSDTEYCLLFREDGTHLGGSFKTKNKYYISQINKTDKNDFGHPTIKPIDFVSNHIINSTNEGDLVFDPFSGSGTTLVAAKQLNRKYLGFEINPEYYEIARDRLNGITQKEKKSGYVQESLF